MTIRIRTAFLIGLTVFVVWFLYFEREILTPFVLAAVFAYIFNPVVNFFSHKIKLPRTLSVVIIYLIIVSLFITLIIFLIRGVLYESSQFGSYSRNFLVYARQEASFLPYWAKPIANDAIQSFENSPIFQTSSLFRFFPRAVSGVLSFFIFLFASFYFLKEGRSLVHKLLNFIPNDYKVEVEILLRRMNSVLGGYLRGQIFMVFLISAVLFGALSYLGVKFALIIAIFSGIAEIVPLIGPIVATGVAVMAVLFGGSINYSLTPFQASVLVIVIYFTVRQVQDYFIIPHVMGRVTKLHPLVILFAVIAGGHSAGIVGSVLAVPFAGVLKILLEFLVDTVNNREIRNKKMLGKQ